MGDRQWSQAAILATRQRVKEELATSAEQPDERLKFILQQIANVDSPSFSEQDLTVYTWIIYALLHHQRHGGLKPSQVGRLYNKALALLQLKKVNFSASRLNYLYGDLRQLMSQIYRADGQHFAAAWEQQVAARLYRDHQGRGAGFQAMGLAVRALRRGDARVAIAHYEETIDSYPALRDRAQLGRAKALRLSGDHEAATQAMAAMVSAEFTDDLQLEVAWEKLCLQVRMKGNIDPVIRASQSRGSHYHQIYILECILWTRATRSTACRSRLPALETLRKKFDGITAINPLYRTASVLDLAYNKEYPFEYRLDRLGKGLDNREHFLSIDSEMLFLIGAARWLVRSHAFGLADVVIHEYRAHVMRLTGQPTQDPLGVGSDLLARI